MYGVTVPSVMVNSDKSSTKIDEKCSKVKKEDSSFLHGWSKQGFQAVDERLGK
jgi:hypothetical protein